MERPFIFCHMLTSIDGKITGSYMEIPACTAASRDFYAIAFGKDAHYRHTGWLSGRVTTDDNFTFYEKPELDENAPAVPEGDFLGSERAEGYYVSIDPNGKLGWKSNVLEVGGDAPRVLEVLTGKASNAYKAFLRTLDIPYIIAGESELDYELMLEKLKGLFGIEMLGLGGGAVLNWSLIQRGLCDELSIVMAPAADGSAETQPLFAAKQGISQNVPVSFELIEAKPLEDSALWLRYRVIGPIDGCNR